MTRTLKLLLAALAITLVPQAAVAQAASQYPNKPIRFVAPIPAGGSTDVLTRDVARRLQERWGQPTVVENKPGGAGSIGSAVVARAPADGYTLLLVNSGHAINGHVYAKLPFDPIKDFVAVVHLTSMPMGIFVHPSVPAKNLAEFMALARAKPGSLSFATSGNGGAGHLGGESFKLATGIDMIHVPYRGSAPAIADVVAGQVPVSFPAICICMSIGFARSVLEFMDECRMRAVRPSGVTQCKNILFLIDQPPGSMAR